MYLLFHLEFARGINCVIGENGSGKSNLIESILLGMAAKDERTSKRLQYVHKGGQDGELKARSSLLFEGCHGRTPIIIVPRGYDKLRKSKSSQLDSKTVKLEAVVSNGSW